MIIALSMRVDIIKEYNEARNAISFDWINLLFSLGIVPVLVPNHQTAPDHFFKSFDFDGLILTGGDDIQLAPDDIYNDPSVNPKWDRDSTEYRLLELAIQNRLPVIGICRGFQLINFFFGGSLTKNIDQIEGVKTDHVRNDHEVTIIDQKMSKLLEINSMVTNSYHNQGVLLKDLAEPLTPFAVTPDGIVVEGFMHEEQPVMGLMWHPEREYPLQDTTRRILERFLVKEAQLL